MQLMYIQGVWKILLDSFIRKGFKVFSSRAYLSSRCFSFICRDEKMLYECDFIAEMVTQLPAVVRFFTLSAIAFRVQTIFLESDLTIFYKHPVHTDGL